MYKQAMQEYIDSGHMELCKPPDLAVSDNYCYLPHHGVVKPTSSSTKLRIVFDASAKTTSNSGCSLNDKLHSGPKLQKDIMEVLTRFRTHPIAMTADIRQMFRRVWVNKEDRNYQLILWRNNEHEELKTYQLNTVTFGMTSSPYLAMRALIQLVEDEGKDYPLASNVIRSDIFVDDIVTGTSTTGKGLTLQRELIELLARGGFHLSKWISNDATLLNNVQETERESPLSFCTHDSPMFQVLGISWLSKLDMFVYSIKELQFPVTKRGILSCVARFYDPLGFISPVLMWAKVLLQHLWCLGLEWDLKLPEELSAKWHEYIQQLPMLSELKVPRHLGSKRGIIHGFSDASERGYAAVVYFVPEDENLDPVILIAKTKVAPTRNVTIPRLELCGAHLLAKVLKFITNSLKDCIDIRDVLAWTDSTVTLAWIRTQPCNLKTFVAGRVAEIQEWLPPIHWKYVSSMDNPADCASGGLYPLQLVEHPLWLHGPKFIREEPQLWPANIAPVPDWENMPDRKPNPINVLISEKCPREPLWTWGNYSSWLKLQRSVAYGIRFINNSLKRGSMRTGLLSVSELSIAHVTICKLVQRECFDEDIRNLENGKSCSGKLKKLTPFLDKAGVLRVGGRIRNSELPFHSKHPILLPKTHPVMVLLVDYHHHIHLHAGPRLLQSILARRYWILSCRSVSRQRVYKCVTCFRHRPRHTPPFMADLPKSRVIAARPFLSVSLDYGGPFILRPHKRSKARCKSYLCLFVCCATKAVHLELVSDVSTQAFVAALQRFVSRRGLCKHIYSDCGTNFKGADAELQKMNKIVNADNETLIDFTTAHEIKWHFQPPSAPHFGGLHEAAIKQAKVHIKRVLGCQVLTYEELYTLCTRVEATLNSRPLIALSSDPAENEVLTPGHFLIGSSLVAPPGPNLDLSSPLTTRWKLLQSLAREFWKCWHRDYLHTLIQRSKWYAQAENLKIDSMVLVQDEHSSPQDWKIARVVEVHKGANNTVRVVKVRTSKGILTRPAVKIFPLPQN